MIQFLKKKMHISNVFISFDYYIKFGKSKGEERHARCPKEVSDCWDGRDGNTPKCHRNVLCQQRLVLYCMQCAHLLRTCGIAQEVMIDVVLVFSVM